MKFLDRILSHLFKVSSVIFPASGEGAPKWERDPRSQFLESGVDPNALAYYLAEIITGTDAVSVEAADTITSTLLRLRVTHA